MAETMRLDVFRAEVLKAAKAAGLEQAEIYTVRADSLRVLATGGQVADYAVADKIGVSLRGVYEGRMGYCSTQALDAEAIAQLIEGVWALLLVVYKNEVSHLFFFSSFLFVLLSFCSVAFLTNGFYIKALHVHWS